MASGLKGYIPHARNPDMIFEVVTASDQALLKRPQNVARDTRLPGKFVIRLSQAFLYAVLNGPNSPVARL